MFEAGSELEESTIASLRNCFIIGRQRTPEQDFEFEIRQLVEVGVRALSPGVNDPFTAENCIDLLAIAMGRITHRNLPKSLYRDGDGEPRLLLRPTDFGILLESAFQRLRYDSCERPDVLLRLLEALLRVGRQAVSKSQREAVKKFVEGFPEEARKLFHSTEEKERYDEILAEIRELD